jgi:putative transposase
MKRITYNLPNHSHFLTFSCYRRQQFLTSDDLRSQLVRVWNDARCTADFAIWSYVIMPEHVHLLVHPSREEYEMTFIWDTIRKAIEYIEWNPVRRGLVSDPLEWRWFSRAADVHICPSLPCPGIPLLNRE